MNTPHVHAAVIKAWADGAVIECRHCELEDWVVVARPNWKPDVHYRVKPKPRIKKYRYVFVNHDGNLDITQYHYAAGAIYVGNAQYLAVQKIDSTMIEVEEE